LKAISRTVTGAGAVGALAQPASSAGRWPPAEHGFDVAQDAAGADAKALRRQRGSAQDLWAVRAM
jgi:hypothetical protein